MIKLLILLLTINTAFAQKSVRLDKDELAPFDGFLITKERTEQLIKAEKKVITLEDLRIAQEQLTEYHKQDAALQRQKLSEAKFDSHIRSSLYFVLGVVLSGFAFKVTQEVNR